MNWQQLRAFLWLEWRLRVNQIKRAGIASVVILSILAVGAVILAVSAFFVALFVGKSLLPRVSPAVLMYVWDGLIIAFLFCWMIGLLAELQRAELLSLEKFLHLPVSLTGAFLINYVSSLVSFSLIVFVPAMVGLMIASIAARGPAMLAVFPLAAAFIFVVSAMTFQFRGWIASLMVNKRRRRTVITIVTASIIVTAQLPNLINVFRPWERRGPDDLTARMDAETAKLNEASKNGEFDAARQETLRQEIQARYAEEAAKRRAGQLARLEEIATIANLVAPPGWLPYGAKAAADGGVLPALAGTLAFSLIGAASLWRAYRTTLRLYTGQFSASQQSPAAAPAAVAPSPGRVEKPSVAMLETRLPWVSEHASAVAAACFRSLTRAPEAKMMLLTPVIMVAVMGSMFLARRSGLPPFARPLAAAGATTMILFAMVQMVGNQFGFDRSGFRAFVLSSAPRRDILLGKNLAFAPLPLTLGALVLAVLECVYPMRVDYFVASLVQMVSMLFVFCLMANLLSLIAPMPIASGSLKPANPKALTILTQIAFVFLFPLAMSPTLIPLGVEFVLQHWFHWPAAIPVCLILSVVETAAIGGVYWIVLGAQGRMLQSREQRILEIVTAKVE